MFSTNNEIFGTHGAKAMYDELTTAIGKKANTTDLTTHNDNTDIHVTSVDKAKWDKVDEKANTSDIPTKVSQLANDSNYQTAKQVNSAVTTEIAKVDASLGELEGKVNNLSHIKFATARTKTNIDEILNIGTIGVYYQLYDYNSTGTKPTNADVSGIVKTEVWDVDGNYAVQEYDEMNTGNRKYMRYFNIDTWSDWQELATMDRVKDGYAKIIKNNDTDTNDAMFIAYKNRDLFGIRKYKDDNSEHELKFNASGISYVKNGVTVWDTRVADVPNTVIVSEDLIVKLNSNCYYTVINGVCYVTLWGFTCTGAGQYVVNSSMPKTKLTMKGVCTYGTNGYEGGCAYILHDGNGNNKLYVEVKSTNEPLYGSFSYPVAES